MEAEELQGWFKKIRDTFVSEGIGNMYDKLPRDNKNYIWEWLKGQRTDDFL
jgi:hypothetical protein